MQASMTVETVIEQLVAEARGRSAPHLVVLEPATHTVGLVDAAQWDGSVGDARARKLPPAALRQIASDAAAKRDAGVLVVQVAPDGVRVHLAPYAAPKCETESSGVIEPASDCVPDKNDSMSD